MTLAPTTMAELLERLRALPTGASTNVYRSVTGEPYVELLSEGIRTEARAEGIDAIWWLSEELAVKWWWHHFQKYYERGGTLYWRIEPELAQEKGCFRIYARLLVSTKPPLAEPAA